MTDSVTFSLVVNSVSKSYGRHLICQGIDLELGNGHSLAVVGPNGSGKSTFLKMLAGLIRPDSGSVVHRLKGANVETRNWYRHVGLVSPELALYEELTGYENLAFSAEALSLKLTKSGFDSLLEEFGLLGRGGDIVGTFSSGMKQRLKFAAAMLKTPSLLLLDEPSVTLDDDGTNRVWDALARRNMTVVIATNIAREAKRASRSIEMGGQRG